MRGGECQYGFPKPQRDNTKRIDGNWEYKRGINDRYVVPYNPTLHKAFKAHINVEACGKMTDNKLLEYLHKGSKDYGNIDWRDNSENKENFNEIDHHLKYRSLLAPEACHRLFRLPTFQKSHEVHRLPIHKNSAQLTKFFEKNRNFNERKANGKIRSGEVDPCQYTYQEFPTKFKWEGGDWKERTNHEEKVIGRIYTVLPSKTEEFALRCLLIHSKGPTSLEDLCTVLDEHGNINTYESFNDAAKTKRLLTKKAYEEALEECKMYLGSKGMRELYSIRNQFDEGEN
ncbi:hypothetical protein B9Z55_008598 [Caenorhabditis nigoni]|uniref:Uncharacterized protein n=1 Tax=Caenorhabditis nigoni TaxID=1611254 RepID=A0A2G5UNA7_9PELO|nr:hypothetical protein B9Z55_008598 [Caenorhabditis nigoni]